MIFSILNRPLFDEIFTFFKNLHPFRYSEIDPNFCKINSVKLSDSQIIRYAGDDNACVVAYAPYTHFFSVSIPVILNKKICTIKSKFQVGYSGALDDDNRTRTSVLRMSCSRIFKGIEPFKYITKSLTVR